MGSGRKKIPMKKIENIYHRRVTFSKRRQGLFKKAAELSLLTGCKVAVLTLSSANKAFFHGDARLFNQVAAARFFPQNFAGLKLKEEAGLGSFSERYGDNDVFCTKDKFEELDAAADDDTDTANVGAEKAVAAWACGMDASSGDIMKMSLWKNAKCYNDNPFQLVPCRAMTESCLLEGFSSVDCYSNKGMEIVQYGGIGGDPGTTGLKVSDGLVVISEEEELDQLSMRKQNPEEAFKEQMREQYRLACEAGEIFEQCPLLYF